MTTLAALCIGDELLDGRIADLNAHHLGEVLGRAGLELTEVRIVPDDADLMESALRELTATRSLVVVTGGLGPTADDRTREIAARLLQAPLEEDAAELERIQARIQARGYTFSENNRQQALFPRGATVLTSEVGTASGFTIAHQGATVLFTPGVPREFRWYVETHLPALLPALSDVSRHRRKLHYFGMGESALETRLAGIEEMATDLGAKIAYTAAYPIISVTLKAPTEEGLDALTTLCTERVGPHEVGRGDTWLGRKLGERLRERGETITTAESCTGGGIAAELTAYAGSSAWFERAWVTYANAAKQEMVGVRQEALEAHGAVSAAVVTQMAVGARDKAGATYALAVSGIAAPGGATPGKPVGTVHFALATPEGTWTLRRVFQGRDRAGVRSATVATATAIALWYLEGRLEAHGLTGPLDDAQVLSPRGWEGS